MLIEPNEGEIEPGTTLTFTFPTAMVGADRIDLADQAFRLSASHNCEGEFLMEKSDRGRLYGPGSDPRDHLSSHPCSATSRRRQQSSWKPRIGVRNSRLLSFPSRLILRKAGICATARRSLSSRLTPCVLRRWRSTVISRIETRVSVFRPR